MLIFNKQFRAEEKLINELRKKIKKTRNFSRLYEGNCEKYVLDNITISFNVLDGDLTVTDKNNNEIVTINCAFKDEPLQRARSNWFSDLLGFARKRSEEKETKIKEMQKAKNAVETAQKAKAYQDAQRLKMLNAAKRIKGL